MSCEGENPADVENIGSIQYIPRRGFPGYYFPYKNQEGYLSPIIAIWFEKPTSKYVNLFFILKKKGITLHISIHSQLYKYI